jgi:hypothetical protein
MADSKSVSLLVMIPKSLRTRTKVLAASHERTLNAIVIEALECFIRSREVPVAPA